MRLFLFFVITYVTVINVIESKYFKNTKSLHRYHGHTHRRTVTNKYKYLNKEDEEQPDDQEEYNITKTYDQVSKYHKKYKKENKGTKRQFLKHNHHGAGIIKVGGNHNDGSLGNIFLSEEPLGTPVGHISTSHDHQEIVDDVDQFGSIGGHYDDGHFDGSHVDATHIDSDHVDSGHVDNGHIDLTHLLDGGHIDNGHLDSDHTFGSHGPVDTGHIDVEESEGLSHHYENNGYPIGGGEEHQILSNSGIVTHTTDYYHPPKEMYVHAEEKSEDGVYNGGFVQPEPVQLRIPGVHHIHQNPVHIEDPHHSTSYEMVSEHGKIHQHPCLNGGLYFAMGDDVYQCICPQAFIGKNCQDKNYCTPCPCKNGGTCHTSSIEPFHKCSCKLGFYGPTCDTKNPCFPNPCKNNGFCTHDGVTYECLCSERFRGSKCEQINNCAPNPCKNGGNCVEEKGIGKFNCECLHPWRGTICDVHSFCHAEPCQNGGSCRESDTSFICDCTNGFTGASCAERVCSPNPCMNGGTCLEEGDKYRCVCLPWTSGELCEESKPCQTKPCMHDGKCIDSFSGFHWSFGPLQYYCLCKKPFKGMNCEYHACRNCHRNAHCMVDHCVCDEGYEGNGESCQKTDNPCHPNPCLNDGICSPAPGYCTGSYCDFRCNCQHPFLPPICRDKNPCDPDPCENGKCIVIGDSPHCECEPGFKGSTCNEKDGCNPNPCQHKATCNSRNNGTVACSCLGEWKPPLCKECGCPQRNIKGVPNMACALDGTCTCPNGYRVDMLNGICEKEVEVGRQTPCNSQPCINGGTCIDVSENDFKCLCMKDFSGKVCQYKTVCNPGPCQNGGTCTERDGKFLGCNCPPHFSPPYCTNSLAGNGMCNPNPCKHNGVCIPNGGGYDCMCSLRYTGPHCNVDKCSNCDKNAKCVAGRCKCNKGFIGNGYICEREMCEMICVEWSTCIDGQCRCNPGYNIQHNTCVPKPILGNSGDEDSDGDVVPTQSSTVSRRTTISRFISTPATIVPGHTKGTKRPLVTTPPVITIDRFPSVTTTVRPAHSTTGAVKPTGGMPPTPPPGSTKGPQGPPGAPDSDNDDDDNPIAPPKGDEEKSGSRYRVPSNPRPDALIN